MNHSILALAFFSILASPALAQKNPPPPAPTGPMSFFITSVGVGDGGNLGGLAGADAHCQTLAANVGADDKTWHAYLSTQARADQSAVNAIGRIGEGPWFNAAGVRIAESLDALIYDNSGITYEHATNEKGGLIGSLSMGDENNQKDIMTGSAKDGTAMDSESDTTCNNWTSNNEGAAQSGHHDRYFWFVSGSSWNSAHASNGCSTEQLKSSGGDGLYYCFAID